MRTGLNLRHGPCLLVALIGLHSAHARAEPVVEAAPTVPGPLAEALTRVPGELADIFGYPFEQPRAFAPYALGVGLLIAFDKPLTSAMQDHLGRALSGYSLPDAPAPFTSFGSGGADGWLALGITGTYLGGVVAGDTRAQRTGIAASKSLAYSMLVSQLVLKSLTGRRRPVESLSSGGVPPAPYTDNPYDFGNSRDPTIRADKDGSSFPSLHFTGWFAVAKVYSEAYGDPWLPYSLMTLGLASDFNSHRHWLSDMVAGGLIGTLIGQVVSQDYFDKPGAPGISVSGTDGGMQLRLSWRF